MAWVPVNEESTVFGSHQYKDGTESRRTHKFKKEDKTINERDRKYIPNTVAHQYLENKQKSKQRRLRRRRYWNKGKAWQCYRLGSGIFRKRVSGQLYQTVRGTIFRAEMEWLDLKRWKSYDLYESGFGGLVGKEAWLEWTERMIHQEMKFVVKRSREMVQHVESREAFKWMLYGHACVPVRTSQMREEHVASKWRSLSLSMLVLNRRSHMAKSPPNSFRYF